MVRSGQKEVAWRILDAQYFGVAQRRRRLFVILDTGTGRAAEILFEREGVRRDTAPSREKRQAATGDVKTISFIPGNSAQARSIGAVKDTSVTVKGDGGETKPHVAIALDCRNNVGIEELSAPVQAKESGGYSLNYINPIAFGGNNSKDIDVATTCNAKGGSGRMDFESETFVTQVPLVGIRRLTPTECARLQGFPDDWNDHLSDSARYRQFGNAVAVPVAEWIFERILYTIDSLRQTV
jgi:DNA (cytosine-5)-methyltransferase 1